MYCQSIRTVRGISRDDRARIATCSLILPKKKQPAAKFFPPTSSDWPRPQIGLHRSLIDKTTPTTPSRQSLIHKRRFGAIPSKRMRIDEFVCTMAAVNLNGSMHNPRLYVCIHSQRNRRKGGVNFDMVARTDPSNCDNLNGDGGGWVCACARQCARVRVCVRACVREYVQACVMCVQYTITIFDPG